MAALTSLLRAPEGVSTLSPNGCFRDLHLPSAAFRSPSSAPCLPSKGLAYVLYCAVSPIDMPGWIDADFISIIWNFRLKGLHLQGKHC